MPADPQPVAGFQPLGETEQHRALRFSVWRARFRGPDGVELERDVVRHPGAVAVLPLHDDDTITMVRQYRAALDDHLWEIPAGIRDVAGEPDEVTARRELQEEVGLAAGRLVPLARFHNSPGFCDEDVQIFLATDLTDIGRTPHGVEEQVMQIERLAVTEVEAMVDDGRITDAKTMIAVRTLLATVARDGAAETGDRDA